MNSDKHPLETELVNLIKKDSSIFHFLEAASLDGIWYWNLEKPEEEWMSPKFWKLFGYKAEEKKHLSSEWQDMIHPDDLKTATENFKRHLEDPNHSYDQVVRYRHKDGHTVWVRCRGIAIRDEDGKPIRMLGAHNDLTQEKETKVLLEKQNRLLQEKDHQLLQAQKLGKMGSWGLDVVNNRLNWSDEIFNIFELDKKKFQASYEGFLNAIHPEDRDEVNRAYTNSLQNKLPYEISHRLLMKDGNIKWVIEKCTTTFDESGNPLVSIGTLQDVTEQKKIEDALKYQGNYLQSIIDGIADPIMVIKEDYTIELMNFFVKKSLDNSTLADPNNPKCYEVSHKRSTPCDGINHPCPLKEVLQTGKHLTVTHNHSTKHEDNHFVELSASPYFNEDGKCIGIIESARDITLYLKIQNKLIEQKNTLDYQAHHDTLTGLPNRVLFHDRLEQAIQKAKRHNSKVALLFIDLDHFKEVNDSLGHDIGDEILKEVTNRLSQTIRDEDTVARLGGDEFTIILEDLSESQNASSIAQTILDTLSQSMNVSDNILYVSSSIGISIYPDDGESSQSLLKFADSAMYKAKDEGRNNFQYYNSSMTEQAFERVVMETSLRNALKNEEFVVYYQPQVNGAKDTLIGMEALVRWPHPTMGLISPVKFIPLAESTGLIVELDRYVMKTAMTQISQWYKEGLNPGKLAMNLAVKQLQKEDFIPMFENLMKETNCKPEWIELEVTEGQIMTHPEEAIVRLQEIKDLGIELAVDDFGTGYSSLAYLKRLPIDKLKIDQAFVRNLPDDEEDVEITKAVIALANSLNLKVIAEGVETKEQKEFLVANGCKNIQGYFYSKPVPADEFELILRNGFMV